jgi:hypothetical protein
MPAPSTYARKKKKGANWPPFPFARLRPDPLTRPNSLDHTALPAFVPTPGLILSPPLSLLSGRPDAALKP